MRLGVDPRKADQMVRGTVNLPHGTGKTARVLVFATGDRAEEAKAAGADIVGVRRADRRGRGRPARLRRRRRHPRPDGQGRPPRPGPRPARPDAEPEDRHRHHRRRQGRRPTSRAARSSSASTGTPTCTSSSARPRSTTTQLVENYAAALDEVLRLKPSASKGRYVQEDRRDHDDGPGHPGRPEPHPQPAPAERRRGQTASTAGSGARTIWPRPGRAAVPLYAQPQTAGRRLRGGRRSRDRRAARAGERVAAPSGRATPRAPCAGAFVVCGPARLAADRHRPEGGRHGQARQGGRRRRARRRASAARPPPCSPSTAASPWPSSRSCAARSARDVTYAVVKNTLTKIAAREAGVDGSRRPARRPVGDRVRQGDPVEAAKGLRDFAKANPLLVIKGGVHRRPPLSPDEIRKLADLESREVLLAKLAGAMKASLSNAVSLFAAPLSQTARLVEALRQKAEQDPSVLRRRRRHAGPGGRGAGPRTPPSCRGRCGGRGRATTPPRRRRRRGRRTPPRPTDSRRDQPTPTRPQPRPAPSRRDHRGLSARGTTHTSRPSTRAHITEGPPPWRSSAPTTCSTRSRR